MADKGSGSTAVVHRSRHVAGAPEPFGILSLGASPERSGVTEKRVSALIRPSGDCTLSTTFRSVRHSYGLISKVW